MATKKGISTLDEYLNDFLEDKVFNGQPALRWLDQGLCIDEATISLEKAELLNLLCKALLAINAEQKEHSETITKSCELINLIFNEHKKNIDAARKMANELLASYAHNSETIKAIPKLLTNARQKALTQNAKKAARARLSKDPIQEAKKFIEIQFKASDYPFHKRGYKAKFAREMLAKYPQIESIKTIERLVAKLSKNTQSAS